jgi:hypothetical protein
MATSPDISKLRPGTKVHYVPFEGCDPSQYQNGVVKAHTEHSLDLVFVVYNCAGEWDRYQEYTGQLTNIRQLREGWV